MLGNEVIRRKKNKGLKSKQEFKSLHTTTIENRR
jgi:hypothetical protein